MSEFKLKHLNISMDQGIDYQAIAVIAGIPKGSMPGDSRIIYARDGKCFNRTGLQTYRNIEILRYVQ